MAMSYVIRKTSSPTMVPLALRAISISSARVVLPQSHTLHRLHVKTEGSNFHFHQFSTAAVDLKLIKVLKSKIKSMGRIRTQLEKSGIKSTDCSMPPATPPADFPFKIEDHAGFITLTRELPEEKIEVGLESEYNVSDDESDSDTGDEKMRYYESDTDNDNNSSSTDSGDEKEEEKYNANPSLVCVPLEVTIFKKDGTLMNIQVLGCADDIIVECIDIHESCDADGYHYAKLSELGRDVRYSLKEFIEVRGINKTNVEFWLTYVLWKYEVKIRFLETFKEFVNGRASSS